MFALRDQGIGILYVSAVGPGKKIKSDVAEGDEVTLHVGDETVLVRGVTETAPGHYTGEIYGFEPSHRLEFEGLSVGSRVEFNKAQIISCG